MPGRVDFGAAPTVSRLTLDDVDAVTRIVGDRQRVAVTVTSGETVRAGTRDRFTSVLGVLETTPRCSSATLGRGTYLTRSDVDTGRRVAVLGVDGRRRAVRRPRPGRAADHDRRRTVPGDRASSRRSARASASTATTRCTSRSPRRTGSSAPTGSTAWRSRRRTGTRSTSSATRIVAELARPAPGHRVQRGHPGADPRRARRHPRASSPACWPRSPASRCWSAASASPTSCWSRCASGPGRSACARRSAPGRATSALQFLLEAVLLTTLGGVIGIALGVGAALLVAALSPVPAGDHLVVDRARVRRLRGGRHHLRRGAGPAGRPPRPGGRPAHRSSRLADADPWQLGDGSNLRERHRAGHTHVPVPFVK